VATVSWHRGVDGTVAASRHPVASGLPIVLAVVFGALSVAVVADPAGPFRSYASTATGAASFELAAGLGVVAGAFHGWSTRRSVARLAAPRGAVPPPGARRAVLARATPQLVSAAVADDGVSGAEVTHGSGLRRLIDRVEAVDGRVDIDSPTGSGTCISVELAVVVATGVAVEPGAENRNRFGSKKRTGHDAGDSNDLYGRSHRVPERSPR
jgi:hypothetical protein